jgi:hypothetical protein
MAALDAVGRWLSPPESGKEPDLLGQRIADAVTKNTRVSVGSYAVGTDGWANPLIARLSELATASDALNRMVESHTFVAGCRRLELIEKLVSLCSTLEESGRRVRATFLGQISGSEETQENGGGLNEVLNELMAFFTPARWAYQDLVISHGMQGAERHFINVTTAGDGARMDLRFNTAELNVFTVALFLLCAVRCENPLRLLILDDPLQNMDELTVTTLARGLAKVVRLLPREWQFLVLFHGEDDLERFRRELPAAVYFLPWLSPAEQAGPLVVNAAETRPESSERFPSISQLLRLR